MYDIGKYYQATSIDDAIRALSQDENAMIICGGSDVLIQIREGRHAGASLVSIHGISELEGVKMSENGEIFIGAATTFSHITNNDIIEKNIPILGHAVDQAGGPQLRNVGTIGGNFCNGVTSADSASSLMVLDAVIEVRGKAGKRMIPITQWYTGPGKTVREHDEVAVGVHIMPQNYKGYKGHYIKYGKRNAMEIATLGCAVSVKLAGDSTADKPVIEDLRIAYGVAAPTPIRCFETEKMAKGKVLNEELYEQIGKSVLTEVNPRTSWRASKEFRLQLIEELVKRALKEAVTFDSVEG